MTPLEINKKIAEIKGFKRFGEKLPDRDNLVEPVYATDFNEIVEQNKNWAENIDDSFELFKDLPSGTIIIHNEELLPIKYVCGADWRGGIKSIFSKEDTVSLAICNTFIKWKEKQYDK